MKNTRFSPSELKSSYNKFEEIIKGKFDSLDDETKEWLSEWRRYDLAISPIDDNERKNLRYGHYVGWFSHKKNKKGE